jgi:hypothetical protein
LWIRENDDVVAKDHLPNAVTTAPVAQPEAPADRFAGPFVGQVRQPGGFDVQHVVVEFVHQLRMPKQRLEEPGSVGAGGALEHQHI